MKNKIKAEPRQPHLPQANVGGSASKCGNENEYWDAMMADYNTQITCTKTGKIIKERGVSIGRQAPTPNPKGQTKYDIELELIGLSENKYNEFMDLYHKFINKDMSYSIYVYVND